MRADVKPLGVDQTTEQSFDFNGESDLDLEYAMALTNPQPITLLQTGDTVEGQNAPLYTTYSLSVTNYRPQERPSITGSMLLTGLSVLSTVSANHNYTIHLYLTSIVAGGDNPDFDGIYPDPDRGGFKGNLWLGFLRELSLHILCRSGELWHTYTS